MALAFPVGRAFPGSGEPETANLTLEFSHFGGAVSITEPSTHLDDPSRQLVAIARARLLRAFAIERYEFTTTNGFVSDVARLNRIDASVGWSALVRVAVGDAVRPGDHAVVCLWTVADSGTTLAIGSVAAGPDTENVASSSECPSATPAGIRALPRTTTGPLARALVPLA
jgi:hypothetical protein